jgi:hypothetical protein
MRSVLDISRNSSQNDNLGNVEDGNRKLTRKNIGLRGGLRHGELARRRKRALACVVPLRSVRMKKENENAGKGTTWLRL